MRASCSIWNIICFNLLRFLFNILPATIMAMQLINGIGRSETIFMKFQENFLCNSENKEK